MSARGRSKEKNLEQLMQQMTENMGMSFAADTESLQQSLNQNRPNFDIKNMISLQKEKSYHNDEEDDQIHRVRINKSPIKIQKEKQKVRNLSQDLVDNPPFKLSNGTKITDFLFVGDFKLANEDKFIKQ